MKKYILKIPLEKFEAGILTLPILFKELEEFKKKHHIISHQSFKRIVLPKTIFEQYYQAYGHISPGMLLYRGILLKTK